MNCFLTLVTAAAISTAMAADSMAQLNFKTGATASFVRKDVVDMKQQGMEIHSEMEFHSTWTIEEVTEEHALIKQTIDRLVVDMQNPMMPMKYDSAAGEEPPIQAAYLANVVGESVYTKVSLQGEELDVKLPEGLTSAAMAQMSNQIKQAFTEIYTKLPETLEAGTTWTEEEELPLGAQSMTATIEHKVDAADQDVITISSVFEIDAEAGAPAGVKLDLNEATREATYDRQTGLVVAVKQNMDMIINAMGMEMPMKSTSTLTRAKAAIKTTPEKAE